MRGDTINPIVNDTFTMGFIFCTGRTRTVGESPGSEPTAAGGGVKGGERVAAVGVQRSPTVGKAHTGHRNRTPAPFSVAYSFIYACLLDSLYAKIKIRGGNQYVFQPQNTTLGFA